MGLSLVWISLALALAAIAFLLQRRATTPGLRVLHRLPLEPRRALLVVEIAGRTLLLASSEAGISMLVELDAMQVAALATAPPAPNLFALAFGRRG